MRHAAALLAVAFISAATGVWRQRGTLVLIATGVGFAAGGVALAAAAWGRVSPSPLRAELERRSSAAREVGPKKEEKEAEKESALTLAGLPLGVWTIEGRLLGDAVPVQDGASLVVEVDRLDEAPTAGTARLFVAGAQVPGHLPAWRDGRRLRLTAALRRPARYFDPGVPDAEIGLARRGVTVVGTVKSAQLVDVVASGHWWEESAAGARAYARRTIAEAVGRWSGQSAAVVTAVVVGDRSALSEEVQRTLQEAGTYHVIAISGGNIAILAGVVLFVCQAFAGRGRGALLVVAAGLVVYAYVVGGGASVGRATSMAVTQLAARAIDLRGHPLNALAVAAIIVALTDPLGATQPAFLLTFGATGALLLAPSVSAPARPVDGRRPQTTGGGAGFLGRLSWLGLAAVWRAATGLCLASLAAEVALLPVGARSFSRVTVAGLGLNLAAIPLMAVAQIAGMVVPAVAWCWPWAAWASGVVAHAAADALVRTGRFVSVVPWATWRVGPPHWSVIAVYYCSLAGLLATRDNWCEAVVAPRTMRRAAGCLFAGALIWILVEPARFIANRADTAGWAGVAGRLHVMFMDVGQGDAAVVQLPGGTSLLVDAGGRTAGFDVGDRVVGPAARYLGVRRLDALLLTHADADHIGGAPAVIRDFSPRVVWEGVPVPASPAWQAADAEAGRAGIRRVLLAAGQQWTIDGVAVTVLNPPAAVPARGKTRNDDSVVVEFRWHDVSVVFTGDIGAEAERAVAAQLHTSPLRVLKVAHHGSATSSSQEFVDAVRPAVAVMSVGRANRFGHPAARVVERYQARDTRIYRTDRDGAVMMHTDGASVEITTASGRRDHIERVGGDAAHDGDTQ